MVLMSGAGKTTVELGLGYALFLGSLTWIATFPVSLSV
jgi:hypothetical protein